LQFPFSKVRPKKQIIYAGTPNEVTTNYHEEFILFMKQFILPVSMCGTAAFRPHEPDDCNWL
jgi:hypothetical protein